jgi:hypothetical protein
MKRHVTPAMVLGVLAVVLAAAGSATAAGLITGSRIKNNSITGIDIRNKSLTSSDFKGSVAGPAGAPGAAGAPGTVAGAIEVAGPQIPMGEAGTATTVESSKAECPPGTVVVGGGFDTGVRTFIGFQGKSGNGYFVIGINTGALTTYIEAQAICGIGAVPRLARASQAATLNSERATLARIRKQAAATQ